MQIFISRPQELLKEVWNDKNISIVEKEHFLGRDKFCLIDIDMNVPVQQEEVIFVDSVFYKTNVRKGNTLIEVTDKGKKKVIWGRKGTEKIIDVRLQYLESITRGLHLNKEEKRSFEYIFRNVNKCLQAGKRIELLKTEKTSGESAQISYCYELNAWVIASQNVSLLAQCLKDLQQYQGKRYSNVKVIARQWFKQTQHLDKDKMKRLKKLLDGFTLIGQYCGDPEYQQLIKYSETRIIWFALVDNFTEEYCVDPFQVRKDIEEFGFKFVRVKRVGSWTDKKLFYRSLEDLYLRVAEAGIEDAEYGMEGSIVYFVSPQLKGNKPHTRVLGAGKLNTIQHQLFSKIRQKLCKYKTRKQPQAQIIRKYQQYYLQLQKASNSIAPYPQFYYIQVLRKGCQLIREAKVSQEFLRSRFSSVLKLLFYVIHKGISLKSFGNQLITSQKFLHQVTMIPLSAYGTLGCITKVIYLPIGLPQVLDSNIQNQLKIHLDKLGLPFKTIESPQHTNDIQKIFNEINSTPSTQQTSSVLSYVYINGSLSIQQITKLSQKLKYKGKKDISHKVILITDKLSPSEQYFTDQHHNEYPFRFQTVLKSYWKGYQEVKSTPTIQEKVDELKKTTEELRMRRCFCSEVERNGVKSFQLQISGNVNLDENEMKELAKIVSCILNSQNQYENYCRLILKLQKYSQNTFPQKTENTTQNEVKNLIKSCFSLVPEVDFVEKQSLQKNV